jgi:predicted nucleic acid-binding protein
MPIKRQRLYWDSCAWIGFINSEKDKIHPLRAIWTDAEQGKYEIWTSAYSYIEVINGFSAHGEPYPPLESDAVIEKVLSQDWVKRVQLDVQVARLARDLKRRFHKDGLKKRSDAIHLASAVYYDSDALITFDGNHLLVLNGAVQTRNGSLLTIRKAGPEDIAEPLFASMSTADEDAGKEV